MLFDYYTYIYIRRYVLHCIHAYIKNLSSKLPPHKSPYWFQPNRVKFVECTSTILHLFNIPASDSDRKDDSS
jgi:hypothetical protein